MKSKVATQDTLKRNLSMANFSEPPNTYDKWLKFTRNLAINKITSQKICMERMCENVEPTEIKTRWGEIFSVKSLI